MSQQAGSRPSAFNRARWQCGLCERLAARTGKARPHNAVYDEPTRNILKFFGYVLTQTAQAATALSAIVVAGGQLDFHAWDMIGDRAAFRFVLWLFVGETQLCCHLGDSDLARFQRQLKLLDTL